MSDDGQTPVDPDAAQDLTSRYSRIRTREQLNDAEASNIIDAVIWIRDQELGPDDLLHQTFLRDLHRRMFGDVWTWAGQLRRRESTIGIAPAQIQEQTQILLGDVRYWIDNRTYGATEIGVRFHHRLVFIHPFVNGNGRHARLAASALAAALALGFDHFSWGARSRQPAEDARRQYLAALRAADLGDYRALLDCAIN